MALSERERFELYERLSEVLGEENGGRLMEILPTTSFQDFATKEDLALSVAQLRAELRADFVSEFAGVHSEFASIQTQFASVHTEFASIQTQFASVHTEFASVRTELASEIASVRTDIAAVRTEAATNMRILVGAQLGTFLVLFALIATRL